MYIQIRNTMKTKYGELNKIYDLFTEVSSETHKDEDSVDDCCYITIWVYLCKICGDEIKRSNVGHSLDPRAAHLRLHRELYELGIDKEKPKRCGMVHKDGEGSMCDCPNGLVNLAVREYLDILMILHERERVEFKRKDPKNNKIKNK
jgi:hypothetical protein